MTVHGAHFSAASEALGLLLCRMGGVVRRAVWASSEAVVCNTTRSMAGEVRVEVSNNGREYTSDGVRLQLVSVRVLEVQPWSGPAGGATVVSVRGRGLMLGELWCRFGESEAVAGWGGGASRLRCAAPPSAVTGWVGVQLSSFHGALSSGGSFYYHAELIASAATPALGPERGGTRVTVLGSGFRDAYTLRCRFENVSAAVLARYVDENQLECVTPVHSLGGKRLLLSMNAQQYSGGDVLYTYQAAAAVSFVSPSTLPAEGGTPVTVHGAHFSAASEALGLLLCRMGGVVRRAVWASSEAVVCNTTRSMAGEVRVEVTNNGREYTSDGVRLQLVSVRVLEVQPWSGPAGGATVVSVRGRGLMLGELWCRFGESEAVAGWGGGASRLRCAAPPSAVTGWVGVQLSSFHGALSSGGSFYYHAELIASAATPALGPERGGTRVTVLGSGFRDAYTLRCRFENVSAAVLARYVDENQLECVTPVHSLGGKRLLLSMNAQQYSGGDVLYTYQAAAAVSFVSPSTLPAEGGTPVTVHGAHFSAASEALGLLLCRMGGVVRRAVWASSEAVVCNTTRSMAGEVRVEVTNNGREYTSDGVRLQLVSVRVLEVQPWSGPAGGATVVSVRGRGLMLGELWCRFGESEARGWLGRRRVAAAVCCASERRDGLGGCAAVELPRRAVERRQLLLPLPS